MYSTPGTSRSNFSMGRLTRCATSSADAPGICTNTSSMGTTIWGSSSRGVLRMLNAPRSSAATITSGVSFESMKLWAMRPARRNPLGGCITKLDLLSVIVLLDLNAFAIQVHRTRFGHEPLAVLEAGQHFDLGPGRLPQSDVAQTRNLVLVQDINALQLAAFDDRRTRNQQCLPLAARKLGSPEQSRTEMRVCWQIDLHEERATRGVRGWNDLHNLAFQTRVGEGIDDDRNLLSCSNVLEIVLVDGGLQSIVAHVLNGENLHTG